MLSDFGLEPTRAGSVDVGEVWGRLTVLAKGQIPNTYRYMAVCQCSCGSPPRAVRIDHIVSGRTVSCGCVQREASTTHGATNSGHYHRWQNIMARCFEKDCPAYENYGGRGITVCAEWRDPAGFVAGLPDGFQPGLEIDRIDNDGNYEPGNVRWSTRAENADNRRSGTSLTWNGRTQSVDRWAKEVGINRATIDTRLQAGWSVEQTLTTPPMSAAERMRLAREKRDEGRPPPTPKPQPRTIATYHLNGRDLTMAQLSQATGIPTKLLRKRICERGWSVERAAATPILTAPEEPHHG